MAANPIPKIIEENCMRANIQLFFPAAAKTEYEVNGYIG